MKIEEYLRELFGNEIVVKEYSKMNEIPAYLCDLYEFYMCEIHGKELILLQPHQTKIVIETLKKHFIKMKSLGIEYPILIVNHIRKERRNMLIQNQIAFIDPNRQAYIPYIYLNINDMEAQFCENVRSFSPSAQLLYIYLLKNKMDSIKITEISERIELSRMSVSRAMRELITIGLIDENGTGTRKHYTMIDKQRYWDIGKNYLISPVEKQYMTRQKINTQLFYSQESALSHLTMINEPRTITYAISKQDKKYINKSLLIDEHFIDNNDYQVVEVWKYNPAVLADKNNNVDIFSLYAMYKDDEDARLEIEFEKLLEEEIG